jgi:hypothetical protein
LSKLRLNRKFFTLLLAKPNFQVSAFQNPTFTLLFFLLNKLFFTLNKIPKAVAPQPNGKKITAPFAHFESIAFALIIIAENVDIIPIKPISIAIINAGNFGKNLFLRNFRESARKIGIKVIKKG